MFFAEQTNYLNGANEALLHASVTWSTAACSVDMMKYYLFSNTTQATKPVWHIWALLRIFIFKALLGKSYNSVKHLKQLDSLSKQHWQESGETPMEIKAFQTTHHQPYNNLSWFNFSNSSCAIFTEMSIRIRGKSI